MSGFVSVLLLLACADAPVPDAPQPVPAPAPPPVPPPPPPLPDLSAFAEPTEERYAATHVLIAWKGAVRAPATVTRSKQEAEALARRLHAGVTPASIETLASDESDGPSAPRGGRLGTYLRGTMVPIFEAAVASVEPGAIAPLVETPFGFHIIRRDAVVQIRARHILVRHAGAHRSDQDRSKEAARAILVDAQKRLKRGEDFAALAREISEDTTRAVGGDLGLIAPGQMVPAFEDAAFALKKGQLSDVVETSYGLHLIQRTD